MQMMKRRRLSADAWAVMVEKFEGSGLSAEAFCQQERVSLTGLQRWRTKPRRVSSDAPMHQAARAAKVEPTAFVDLGALPMSGSRVEVRLDFGGVVLQLSRS
jgi:hypothetical protein